MARARRRLPPRDRSGRFRKRKKRRKTTTRARRRPTRRRTRRRRNPPKRRVRRRRPAARRRTVRRAPRRRNPPKRRVRRRPRRKARKKRRVRRNPPMHPLLKVALAAGAATAVHGVIRAYMPAGTLREVLPPVVKAVGGYLMYKKNAAWRLPGAVLLGLAIADGVGLLMAYALPDSVGAGKTPESGQFVNVSGYPNVVWGFPKASTYPLYLPRLENDPALYAYAYEAADLPSVMAERQRM